MTKGSIEWTKISPRMKVIETPTHFEAGGKLVTWDSKSARNAQFNLHLRAMRDKAKFKK